MSQIPPPAPGTNGAAEGPTAPTAAPPQVLSPEDLTLKGQTIIVTGGNSGIGEGICLEAGRQGANVVIDYVTDEERAAAMVGEIEAMGGRAIAVKADVSKVAELENLVTQAVETFGRLDVMVNNAGVETGQSTLNLTEDKFDWLMAINVKGAVFGTKLAAEQFVRQGTPGVIINMSSTHEDWPMPGDLGYCVSKGAMRMLTRNSAVELGKHGIRVLGIGPGAIATPINKETMEDPEQMRALTSAIPLGYMGTPEEMGRLTCFLASKGGSYVTATTIMADGGLMQSSSGL
ncbi:MAG: glucose 1-dehydrogenase [Micrococcales bacterium]|nr:glucose 1-dehydrogenase [Micrococcales bacterium]